MAASGGTGGLGGTQNVNLAAVEAAAAKADAAEVIASQEGSEMNIVQQSQDMTNPAAATRTRKKEEKFKTLESRKKSEAGKTEKKAETTEDKSDADLADKYTAGNSEISGQELRGLHDTLSDDSSPEEILSILKDKIKDPALQSLALDYLVQTTSSTRGKLKDALIEARNTHTEQLGRTAIGGKNILFASQEYAEQLNVSPSGLRSLYLEVTGNTHTCDQLLSMLQDRYTYKDMAIVSSFLMKGMSTELKRLGPYVPGAQLQVLMTETRNLQAVLTSYDYFEARVPVLLDSLKAEGIQVPENINFVKVAESFHKVINDKFPTASKIEREVRSLIGDDTESVTGVLNLFFTALRQTSSRLFSSADKRQQLGAMMANALDSVNISNEDYPKASDFPKPYPWS
ncbi:type III secretion regulator YopN/LcrE/InvE/MxiC,HrpJ-like domain [Chlamydia serpentis]|uniref:Type III secretion regulator YopN/LcrE/InvE/MxiC,HrpJ-like domain n=1 Tax=Chlamydia serpentis TaxID=1967782 RepID=A0A2R8FAL2_9CHLA|nr:type III secretion system gatekeeper subunit SctW [Chlamydia serpentis]SPN73468.1 type III secretion regulator YopN/LcrE/InvE/MxiC,HrpJ-like domain [Chlamydia serpentis]